MANEVWEEVKRYWGKISTRESNQSSIICRVCGHDKSKTPRNKKGQTVCEATKEHCKESKKV